MGIWGLGDMGRRGCGKRVGGVNITPYLCLAGGAGCEQHRTPVWQRQERASFPLPPGSSTCAPHGPIAAPRPPILHPVCGFASVLLKRDDVWVSSVSLVSAAACFQFNTRHPTSLRPSLLCADELHECSFQEPSGFETKKRVQQPLAVAPAEQHQPAAPNLALPAALQHQHEQPAPARPANEPEQPPRPPAVLHVCPARRAPAWPAAAGPPQQPAAAHQHRQPWIPASARPAHGLPSPARASGLSSPAGLRPAASGPAAAAALPRARASQPADGLQPATHGRGRRRGALQGPADRRYRFRESARNPPWPALRLLTTLS